MKIKVTEKSYDDFLSTIKTNHLTPSKQSPLFRWILKVASAKELKDTNFKCNKIDMDKLSKGEPCLVLMNHSSFTDLQIVATLFSDIGYHIVCTRDGFVGKDGIMRAIGCIPTDKFVTDISLVKDMKYCFDKLHESVIMFPEASYSFDGTETPLPQSLGKCIKLMQVPVVIIKTHGAFLRDPLYNNLQKRQVDVSADVKYVLSKEDTKTMSAEDINNIICAEFSYDHFKEQFEKGIKITEPFRADGLHRALYKCPCCKTEGKMLGLGTTIECNNCNKSYELTELGKLKANDGETEFEFVTDWYKWERECVKEEIENNTYYQKYDVDILALSDTKSMYKIGDGVLEHTTSGFELNGCDNKLHFSKKANTSYSLYADYFWYELGDMISIGDTKVQYYCFPKDQKSAIVAKARLATEELFKLTNKK